MDNVIFSPSGNVSIQISEDRMSAWMTIHKSGKVLDENEILELIKTTGICYGQEDAFAWMAEHGFDKDYEKPFPIAICKPSESRTHLNYHFDVEHSYTSDKDWTWDDVRNWKYIIKDSILADLSVNLFDEGGSIYNVLGELISNPAERVDLNSFIGQNVYLDKDSNSIFASITGYPYVDDNGKINVIDKLEFNQDIVDIRLPINLAASLKVNGSVIRARLSVLKDLTVSGDIRNSEVYIEGSLEVNGDIADCLPPGLTVLNDTQFRSISNSLISCRGQLSFSSEVTGSHLIADKGIIGSPDFSSVAGSHLQTSGIIEISSAGSNDGLQTELEVTISPFLKQRITQLTREQIKLKAEPDYNADKIQLAEDALQELEHELSEDLKKYLVMENKDSQYVKVHNSLFKGVYIRVLKRSFSIKHNQGFAEFYAEE